MDAFSQIYRLEKEQAELDFVDITPGCDLPLYLDPYALTTREDDWSEGAHHLLVSFFEELIRAIKNDERNRAIQILAHLGEPYETHLGVSKDGNRGRGVGGSQADQLYLALRNSRAAKTGILEDISDFALFIPGIGRDKISDITTNVVRGALIEYTQAQCELHGVPMRSVPSGFVWCQEQRDWKQDYVNLPVYEQEKILLVPKYAVRYQVGVDHTRFRRMFVLEFLRLEHLRAGDSLVKVLKNKKGHITKRVVLKKTVDEYYPKDKDFLSKFSEDHPEVLDRYRDSLKSAATRIPDVNGEEYVEGVLADNLASELRGIKPGSGSASQYHAFCIGLISFLFFPNLVYPKKEAEINQGRKRVDIIYTNGKDSGFFYRVAMDQHIKANAIYFECKNYNNEIKNPEIDQIIGRFDKNRGRLGFLMFRASDDFDGLVNRCRDVARQGLGIVIPVSDAFIFSCLNHVKAGERNKIDKEVDDLFQKVIS